MATKEMNKTIYLAGKVYDLTTTAVQEIKMMYSADWIHTMGKAVSCLL